MPSPTLFAEPMECGWIRAELHGHSARRRVRLEVEGVVVAEGRGDVRWEGPAPHLGPVEVVGVARARSVTRSVTADLEAHAWLHLAPSRADRAAVTACVATRCPVDDLRWSLIVSGLTSEPHAFPEVAAGRGLQSVCATVREPHPPGPFDAQLEVTRGADVVARAQDSSLLGPACVDRDGDGACLADGFPGDRPDCDDADATVAPTATDPPDDGRDQDCDGRLAGDRDGDGWDGAEDCAPDDRGRHPGAPELPNGLDDDCDGHVPADEERPLELSARDGRLGVRDGAIWRLSPPRSVELQVSAGRPIPGPHGGAAWVVETEVSDHALASGTAIGWPEATVAVPSGASGLVVVATVPLPGARLVVGDALEGSWTRSRDDRGHAVPTPDGFRVGGTRYTWTGDLLRPRPASPEATVAIVRAAPGLLEVENRGAAPVDLTGLAAVWPDGRLAALRPAHGATALVAPGARGAVSALTPTLDGPVPASPAGGAPVVAVVDGAGALDECTLYAGTRVLGASPAASRPP